MGPAQDWVPEGGRVGTRERVPFRGTGRLFEIEEQELGTGIAGQDDVFFGFDL